MNFKELKAQLAEKMQHVQTGDLSDDDRDRELIVIGRLVLDIQRIGGSTEDAPTP